MIQLPEHACLVITHQPHIVLGTTLQDYFELYLPKFCAWDDPEEINKTGNLWEIKWRQKDVTGFYYKICAAASLERAIELANRCVNIENGEGR